MDERDWPAYTKGPPVGYVAQECLEAVEDPEAKDFQKIRHPFLLSMFLGTDNRGAYIPCMYFLYVLTETTCDLLQAITEQVQDRARGCLSAR